MAFASSLPLGCAIGIVNRWNVLNRLWHRLNHRAEVRFFVLLHQLEEPERDVARIKEGSRGEFIHSVNPLLSREWRVHSIESVSPESITIPELIPHITGRKSHGQAALSPSESLYKVILHESASTDKKGVIRQHGIIRISAESRIPAWEAMKSLLGLLRREISLY